MDLSPEHLRAWMEAVEGEHFEFKAAERGFHSGRLAKYCAALANEGGGKMILGVTNERPRKVVGTSAFKQYERTRQGLLNSLHLRIEVEEIRHADGRVLVFHVPSRAVGTPVKHEGIYWMREGDSLVPMSEDRLREIFAESGHDFSADICSTASLGDLAPAAIEEFRRRWIAKSKNEALANLSPEQLLTDAEALLDGKPTYCALVLFGTRRALGRCLSQAEVVFEYRSSEAAGPAQDRREYRRGFFSFYDELWNTINLRNDKQHYQEGLFVLDVPTFSERPVREAILNAISHHDYLLGGSVFIRQYARRLEIVSPGGLPVGITLENMLDRQSPRNRRIADIFYKANLVERSGQGMDLMFRDAIRQSKPMPDFIGTDQYQVALTLHGTVQDPAFIRFLERVGQEKLATFATRDWQLLGCLSRGRRIPEACRSRVDRLLSLGVVERVRRGRFILSRRYYELAGRRGVYTRRKGLDRETKKELLLRHIRDNGDTGTPMGELLEVLPSLSREQIRYLLHELAQEGKLCLQGRGRAAKWFPCAPGAGSAPQSGEKPN
jgi:ATP-dependent DNA helicase RecG